MQKRGIAEQSRPAPRGAIRNADRGILPGVRAGSIRGQGRAAAVTVTAGPGGKFATAERMATAIIELYGEQGGCLPDDLRARGFTREEIERHWALAKALAHVALKITDA